MILIYPPSPIDKHKIDTTIEILKDKFSVFFIGDDYFIYTTETNQKLLRELILTNKVSISTVIDGEFNKVNQDK